MSKSVIQQAISQLSAEIAERELIIQRLRHLQGEKPVYHNTKPAAKNAKRSKQKTAAYRKAASERAKAYWRKKKAAAKKVRS